MARRKDERATCDGPLAAREDGQGTIEEALREGRRHRTSDRYMGVGCAWIMDEGTVREGGDERGGRDGESAEDDP